MFLILAIPSDEDLGGWEHAVLYVLFFVFVLSFIAYYHSTLFIDVLSYEMLRG